MFIILVNKYAVSLRNDRSPNSYIEEAFSSHDVRAIIVSPNCGCEVELLSCNGDTADTQRNLLLNAVN